MKGVGTMSSSEVIGTNIQPGGPVEMGDIAPLRYADSIRLIRMTLADICIQASWSDVSPWRFLNRASLLFQVPLCFAVFCYRTAGYILGSADWNTVRDPLYHQVFEEALAGIGVYKAGDLVPKEQLDSYAIRLFDTDFYIVAFRVQGGRHDPCSIQEVSYIPVPREDPIGATLVAALLRSVVFCKKWKSRSISRVALVGFFMAMHIKQPLMTTPKNLFP
jgi:hypothetical protein